MTPDPSLEPEPPVRGQILSFLSWTGLTTASLGLVLSLDLFLLTYILHEDLSTTRLALVIPLTALYLTVNIALLIFSVKLRRLSDCQDIPQLKKLITVACYAKASLDLLICLVGIGYSVSEVVVYIPIFNIPRWLPSLPLTVFGTYLVFVTLMIHGTRKSKLVLIKLYLIFKIVIYIMFLVSCILFFSLLYPSGLVCLAFSNIFLVMTFYYLYSNGFVFVLYKLLSSDVIPDSVCN